MIPGAVAQPLGTRNEDDVLAGLRGSPKQLPCRLLYDARGAALFEQITALEDYYPARTELALLDEHLAQIAAHVGPAARVIEPGCGAAIKSRRLLAALDRPSSFVPIDVAHEQLERVAVTLRAAYPEVEIQPLVADYTCAFEPPVPQHGWRRTLVFFPGSTIGNFEPAEARDFLCRLGHIAGPDRMLLLGADSTRDPRTLLRAYDDELGVTAAFDKNVLANLNRTRGATFELDAFEHAAVWNAAEGRIEMHLVSKRRQIVWIQDERVTFAAGESIVTEHCYKHAPESMRALLASAGWRLRQVFTAADVAYRLWLCEPIGGLHAQG